ncbi:outer membrane protein with glycine zipper [Plasticicumulans lactativorans]|uniref:Outer membrane protein with glycine zipper n=1 Tax=Plasticicumulans lactativorans TaxID=1133106 RepID=A0A4R2LA44_9GAMM|nr:type VI secretion system-associated lipoprotein TagQ [Plasticicumulans lactativorans]TCO83698.1 outer membrane protein with glycine zipper [Plasticicumulans lactativorans]
MTSRSSHCTAARALAAAVALSLGLGGCVTLGNPTSTVAQSVVANYYPRCYEPVAYLRQSEERLQQSVVAGAATGALAGGLLGALTGGDNAGRNALIGAAVGAVAGGVSGYYMEKQKQVAEDSARFAAYGDDINQATGEFDRTIASAKQAQSCYQKEYQTLLQAKRGKRMSDSEGRARLAEIVTGLNETNALMTAVDGRLGENLNTYTQAYETDLQKGGYEREQVQAVATRKARPPKPIPAEAVKTEQQLKKATDKREEGKLVVSRGNSLVRDICSNPDMGDWGPGNACQGKGA